GCVFISATSERRPRSPHIPRMSTRGTRARGRRLEHGNFMKSPRAFQRALMKSPLRVLHEIENHRPYLEGPSFENRPRSYAECQLHFDGQTSSQLSSDPPQAP